MSDETVVPTEQEVEAEGAVVVTEAPQTADQMDVVIGVASKIEAYAKAIDAIVGAVVKRSYPGDWVVHKKTGDKDEDQKANMGAAAAERMAAFVGITESNWSKGEKQWSDDHKHYTYAYEADFTFGKRTIHVISRVGTRDKFFGKSKGEWKPLEEVQEDDIKKAAFRACRKEGVRTLLGLRNVPVAKLQQLGFDIAKINFVGFEDKGKALDASAKEVSRETGMASREIIVATMAMTSGKSANGDLWQRWDIKDKEGVKWTLWGNGRRAALLNAAMDMQELIKVEFQTKSYKGTDQHEIIKVAGEIDQ